MSNKTQLQTNNTALDALITRVNTAKETAASLPDAGSGSSIETCRVVFYNNQSDFAINYICWSSLNSDGSIIPNYEVQVSAGSTITLQNIVKNSAIVISYNDVSSTASLSASGGAIVIHHSIAGINFLYLDIIKATSDGVLILNTQTFSCCFTEGTQVLTSLDGQTRSIEMFKVGDEVVSFNIETRENYLTKVKQVIVHENTTDIAEVSFENGASVSMNAYHPLYTDNGWHSLTNYNGYDTLMIGDNVKTVDGWTKITNINRHISEPIITYNIDVTDINENSDIDTNDTYYANGIVAHNGAC